MAEKKFAIRFSAEDMDKVRTALKGMGTDGASALRALETGSSRATPALRAVDNAAKEVRQSFDSFAGRIPIIGSSLQALGPAGTAAAAGILGIGLAITAGFRSVRQTIDDLSALKDAADNVGLSIEDFQAVRGAGLLEGINGEAMEQMLSKLAINSARASEGFGKMRAALEEVNPELGRQLAVSTNQAQRLDILAMAVQQATSYNEKLNIAVAAFGTEGRQMVRVLDESGAAMDAWREQARKAGLIVDEGLVTAVEAAGDRIQMLEAKTKTATQYLAVAAVPLVEEFERGKAEFATGLTWLAVMQDGLKEIQDRQYFTLVTQRAWKRELIANDGDLFNMRANELKELEVEIAKREAVIREEASSKNATTAHGAAYDANEAYVKEQSDARAAARKKAAADAVEAAKAAAEASRLREQQEKSAIEIRASLGDWTGKLAQREQELTALVNAGALSRETANAALVRYRGELDGSTETMSRWKSAVESTQTPVEKAQAALEEFVAEAMVIGERGPAFQAALRYYSGALKDAETAAKEATPAFKAVAEARALIARDAESMLTVEERVAAQQAILNKLVGEHGFTAEEATRALQAYRNELQRTGEDAKESGFELRFAAETLGSILDDNMNSLEDLGKTALRVFRQMAIEWILANKKMAAGQSIWEFVGNAITSAFSGGGASGRSDPALGAYPVAGTGDPGIDSVVGFHHAGTSSVGPNSATFSRAVRAAPRFHEGLDIGPDERLSVLQDGERVMSRMDNRRIVSVMERTERALDAAPNSLGTWEVIRQDAPKVEVHFHGEFGGKPEVKQSRGSDGSMRIDVIAKQAVVDAANGGALDKVMQQRYGLNRSVTA